MPLLKWLKWPKVAAGEWLLCRRSQRGVRGAVGGYNLCGRGEGVVPVADAASGSSDFHAIRIRS